MAKTGTNLGPVDLNSDVPPGRGILWPKAILHQVSLTFGQPLGQADLQTSPWWRHLVDKSSTTSGQLDIWSAFGSG